MTERIQKFLVDESGPTSVEYAVMLAMIVGVCIASVNALALIGEPFSTALICSCAVFGKIQLHQDKRCKDFRHFRI